MMNFLKSTKGLILMSLVLAVVAVAAYQFGMPAWVVGSLPFVPVAFGTTYNMTGMTVTSGVPDNAGSIPMGAPSKVYVRDKIIDLTGYTTDDGQLTTGAVLQALDIPADTLVMNTKVEVITPAVGTTCTLDLGDGAGHDSWDSQFDGKAAAGTFTHSVVGTDAYMADDSATAQGKFYDTADTIDFTVHTGTALTAGPKLKVSALCVDYN